MENQEKNEVLSRAVKAGKRTYFFDVKSTKTDELYLTITESKRKFNAETGNFFYEKHKVFLYKEDFEKFQNDRIIQKAIKMDLFQIGELVGNLSPEAVVSINTRDYKGIKDIRNYIAHGYIEIKDSIVWNTIIFELPTLIESLNQSFENKKQ